MLFHYTRNNVATTVVAPRTAGDPTLVVADGTRFGDRFPLLATVARRTTRTFQGINIVVAEAILCILEVTGRTGNTLTTSGAVEGTTDSDLVVGDLVEMRPTALPISELQDAVAAIQDAFVTLQDAVVTIQATNKDAATLPAGSPVAIHGSGIGIVAAAAADMGRTAVGLVRADVAAGAAGTVQVAGPLVLADWSAATGLAALAARATYFLDVAAGRLTTDPPKAAGQALQLVGTALAPDTLDLAIQVPILL